MDMYVELNMLVGIVNGKRKKLRRAASTASGENMLGDASKWFMKS